MRLCPYSNKPKNTVICTENLRAKQGLPVPDAMPDPYMLPLRQAKKNRDCPADLTFETGPSPLTPCT